ncbi:MAG: hypothetical protein JSU01_11415 [Bacteroidetes bacterium]|nr:hypothetical protein [Bacteroidota bacterium]
MRELIFSILTVPLLLSINHQNAGSRSAQVSTNVNIDTIFISKDQYHRVYIEQNRRSPLYTELMDFKMDKSELDEYKGNYRDLKKHFPAPLTKYDLQGLSREWIPLYKYKGKYYIYSPSEEGNEGRRIITDSTMVYWFMDGPNPQPLLGVRRVKGNTWYLNVNSYFKNISGFPNRPDAKLIIHIIDPKNKIAVWEDKSQPQADRYELLISKDYAKNFDMIVNRSIQTKVPEFQFDKIDYAALLKNR